MGRYKDIFSVVTAKKRIPSIGKIQERDTDLYMTYTSADRLDMVSYRVYGDPSYWWVILAANEYQIEFDIESGEVLRIPWPLSDAINTIRKNTQ
jgi:nucleoid-associated protein YgaU